MKKTNIDDKSKFMYAVILAVVIVAGCFLLGYKKLEDKADSLNAENRALENRIASLETYYNTEEQNKADKSLMTADIIDIFSGYAGDARYEDAVYEAYNLYGASKNTLIYDAIGFDVPLAVKEIPVETVQAAEIEGLENAITFYQFDVSYAGKLTYSGLKGVADEINTGDYNLAVGQMNYQINDDGYLDGKTMTSFYFVYGAGCQYEEPPIAKYDIGLSDLFGVSGSANVIEN